MCKNDVNFWGKYSWGTTYFLGKYSWGTNVNMMTTMYGRNFSGLYIIQCQGGKLHRGM